MRIQHLIPISYITYKEYDMLKILSGKQMREADQYTIAYEPVSSLQLMERAAAAFVAQFGKDFVALKHPVYILCGPGNNGGDGLAVARMLLHKSYEVWVWILPAEKHSADFSANYKRLESNYSTRIRQISSSDEISRIPSHAIVIDAILGTGLNEPVQSGSRYFPFIQQINECNFEYVVSVDIPSGLFADQTTPGIAVKAHIAYTFQSPKLAMLLPENGVYVQDFKVLDIGLHEDYLDNAVTDFYYLEQHDANEMLHDRSKYSHKGTFGHACIMAGSYGKMGAAVLSAKACLRSGAGLVTARIPACGYEVMQTAVPEVMCLPDVSENILADMTLPVVYDALAVGPGIGTAAATAQALQECIAKQKNPMVLDADALNILSQHPEWLSLLPSGSILTPHPREFQRLAGSWENDFERLSLLQQFARKYGVTVVLKGAHTAVATPDGKVYFNATGNAGMATAGSGDVLTGIIAGLLAQRYTPEQSAILGVYLHGLAGDMALQNQSMESMIASDIIDALGAAFRHASY